jgi:predicted dehydrogenase
MTRRTLNVALIGHKFMGNAHSQAWLHAGRYFDLDADIALKVVCGRDIASLAEFAGKWGWEQTSTDWQDTVTRICWCLIKESTNVLA